MALAPDELARRIKAARVLCGMAQDELGRLFKADGLGEGDPGRIERGELGMQRVHLNAFKHHLQMPEWWFTAPKVVLPPDMPQAVEERLDDFADQLDAIRVELLAALGAQDPDPQLGSGQGTSSTSARPAEES